MRTCYRSKWRLHEDPTILTAGRYYRAADDAPDVPFATYLGSRDWIPEGGSQDFGEWDGAHGYDQGVPPRVLPSYSVIGGDCLSRLLPVPDEDAVPRQFGRCVKLDTREICGNIPLFTNFSIAHTGEITYYEHLDTYITKDTGTGEWIGKLPGQNIWAKINVSEITPTSLDWRFALGDKGPVYPPVTVPCCGPAVPGSMSVDFTYLASSTYPAFTEAFRIDFSLELVYSHLPILPLVPNINAWWAYAKCDGTQGTAMDHDFIVYLACGLYHSGEWDITIRFPVAPGFYQALGGWYIAPADVTCSPFSIDVTGPKFTDIGHTLDSLICGHTVSTPQTKSWAEFHIEGIT